jgi:sugar lactone lactonase YvrE
MKWTIGASEGIVVAGGQGQGNKLTQLSNPGRVIVDQLGDVYVTDSGNHRIMHWPKGSTRGSRIAFENTKWSNQFDYSEGLSIDQQGHLYAVDCRNVRVQKIV